MSIYAHLRRCVTSIALLCALFGLSSANAEGGEQPTLGDRFVAGTHYEVLEIPVNTRQADKIEVIEMFSYACNHCANFDPYIQAWKTVQPEDVDFHPVPAIFNADWERLAQAFYTAETLGVTDKIHTDMFLAIHERNQDVRRPEVLAPLFNKLAEVPEGDFMSAFNSFSVRSRVQQAKAMVRAYRIDGVPSMIVNGKYIVDGKMAGGNVRMLDVVDFLVAKERESQPTAAEQETASTQGE